MKSPRSHSNLRGSSFHDQWNSVSTSNSTSQCRSYPVAFGDEQNLFCEDAPFAGMAVGLDELHIGFDAVFRRVLVFMDQVLDQTIR